MEDSQLKKVNESGSIVIDGVETVKSKIKLVEYNKDKLKEETYEKCREFQQKDTLKWIKVEGYSYVEVEEMGKCFNLHYLVLEDIKSDHRPKIEAYDDYLLLILKAFNKIDDNIITKQVSIILGDQFVISFQEEGVKLFESVEKQIKIRESEIRSRKSDFLLYALVNAVLNSYYDIIDEIEDEIDAIEKELVYRPNKNTLYSINKLKRDIITLQKAILPLNQMTNTLETTNFHMIDDSTRIYLRDVYDHSVRITAMMDSFRDTISGMLDTYLSSMSNNLNDIVRVLTIITVIFAPLTFVTGFFGMNFQNIIPIFSTFSIFYAFLAIMIFIPVIMVIYFRKKGWLG
ncbi:MAG: magnesium/cobalt transporter CorA [Methanobacterium sp.]